MTRYVVFDTETTGLNLHPEADLDLQPRCIEFGAAVFEDDQRLLDMDILIHPGFDVSDEITRITGITNDMLVGALSFEAALPQIAALAFEGQAAVFAHNLPFDKTIIANELRRVHRKDPVQWSTESGLLNIAWWPKREICTVGLFKDQWGRNPKLTELYERTIGKKLAQTHRALDDVNALAEIILKEKLWQLI